MWYWLFKYIFMGPLLALLGRPKIEGLEHVPHDGPAILASNHLAVADSFYLPLVVRRRITFLAKAEYFTGTGLKGRLTRWFYTVAGQVPIDRTDADSAQSALDTAERLLNEGKLLGLYPEGTRSPDGRLYKGKTGLARIALHTGVPVIPVAMIGTDVVNPPGSSQIRVHQHLDMGQGEIDWDLFFKTLAEVKFDGVLSACVFAWEERAEESSRFMRTEIQRYLDHYPNR